jgi:hypothetical protein
VDVLLRVGHLDPFLLQYGVSHRFLTPRRKREQTPFPTDPAFSDSEKWDRLPSLRREMTNQSSLSTYLLLSVSMAVQAPRKSLNDFQVKPVA